MLNVPVKKLDENAKLPEYKTTEAAAADLFALPARADSPYVVERQTIDGRHPTDARLDKEKVILLPPGARVVVPTGLAMAIPVGVMGEITGRSGAARKHGISVTHGKGTIDPDYRGEVGVMLINHGDEPFTIRKHDRVGQIAFVPVARAALNLAEELPETERGEGGFGSTGVAG